MGSLARNSKRRKPARSAGPSSKLRSQPDRRRPSNHAAQALLSDVRHRLETVMACSVVVAAALKTQCADADLDAALGTKRGLLVKLGLREPQNRNSRQ